MPLDRGLAEDSLVGHRQDAAESLLANSGAVLGESVLAGRRLGGVGAVKANNTKNIGGTALRVAEEGAGARDIGAAFTTITAIATIAAVAAITAIVATITTTATSGDGKGSSAEEKDSKVELHVDDF